MTSLSLKELGTLARREAPGPNPFFTELHLMKALYVLEAGLPVGRASLAKSLGLGEGSGRTLIRKLRKSGFLVIEREGCRLSAKGSRLLSALRSRIQLAGEVDAGKLSTSKHCVAVTIRMAAANVTSGLAQRDAAIRNGANEATTLVIKRGRFAMPGGSSDCEGDYPGPEWKRLRKLLEPKESDAIILCGGETRLVAEYGALAAARTLL